MLGTRHVQVRPMTGCTIDLHTRDPHTDAYSTRYRRFRVSYPTYSLPDRVSPATFFPVVAVFGNAVMSRRNRIIRDEFHQHSEARLDSAHVTRIYPAALLSGSGQFSKVHRALMTEKTGLITPGRMCIRDGMRRAGERWLLSPSGIHRSILPDVSRTRRRRFEPPRFNQKVS